MVADARPFRGWWVAALLSAITAATSPAAAASDDEARATFVLLLGKYVTWPSSAFSSASAPIVVVVMGNPALASEVKRLAAGQQLEGRAIEVRDVADASGAADAHIVFTSDAAQSSALADARPLRVIEGKGGLRRADVQIQLMGGRVAFAVNRKHAAQRGLKLSSKLLRLASSLE
jgi:hypothetical protein